MDKGRVYRFFQGRRRFCPLFFRTYLLVPPQLETDPALLIPKARTALERYGHQVVIGNDLHRRKFEVVFVSRKHGSNQQPAFEESWLNIEQQSSDISRNGPEIEQDIVAELVRRHSLWIAHGRNSLLVSIE